jgi:D-3-phosphoglycerate dehydrogenase
MKDGVRILNFARGELVDSAAMLEALANGKVAAYVVDFPSDEMLNVENVIAIPHLGASTPESEDNCAMMAADELIAYLERGIIRNSVNFPAMDVEKSGDVRICVLHRNIPNMLAQISAVVSEAGVNIENMTNRSKKDNAYTVLDIVGDVPQSVLDGVAAIENVIRVRKI